MKLYLLNALIVPFNAEKNSSAFFAAQKIDQMKYKSILQNALEAGYEIVSVLGHMGTVDFLKNKFPEYSQIFSLNRIEINLEEGDLGLIIRVGKRGEKMIEYTQENLFQLENEGSIEYLTVSRIASPDLIFNTSNFGGHHA